jgi:hypothetical protein
MILTIAAGILLAVFVLNMLRLLPHLIVLLFVLWVIGHFTG